MLQIEQEPYTHVRAKREPPGEQPVRGDPIPAGARGYSPGSQSTKGGLAWICRITHWYKIEKMIHLQSGGSSRYWLAMSGTGGHEPGTEAYRIALYAL